MHYVFKRELTKRRVWHGWDLRRDSWFNGWPLEERVLECGVTKKMQCACEGPRFWSPMDLTYSFTFSTVFLSITNAIIARSLIWKTRVACFQQSATFWQGSSVFLISGHCGLKNMVRKPSRLPILFDIAMVSRIFRCIYISPPTHVNSKMNIRPTQTASISSSRVLYEPTARLVKCRPKRKQLFGSDVSISSTQLQPCSTDQRHKAETDACLEE